jgi:hypothetical protein
MERTNLFFIIVAHSDTHIRDLSNLPQLKDEEGAAAASNAEQATDEAANVVRQDGATEGDPLLNDINERLSDLRDMSDLAVNRSALFAYLTYKASKGVYLRAADIPWERWGPLMLRKWNDTELFAPKDLGGPGGASSMGYGSNFLIIHLLACRNEYSVFERMLSPRSSTHLTIKLAFL